MEINEKKNKRFLCKPSSLGFCSLLASLFTLSIRTKKKLNINCKRYNLGGFVQLSFKPHVKIR